MKKSERQKILQALMEQHEIKRQEDFVEYLKDQGIPVTQATISRDIKEMNLIKIPSSLGEGYRYSLPLEKKDDALPRLRKLLRTALVSCEAQDKMTALKTQPGTGPALSHLLEEAFGAELFTLMTDDNHVLMIARSPEDANNICQTILTMMTRPVA